ncbi:unnamed protein product, partial [Allacma fusca]
DEGDEGAAFVFISTGESLIQQGVLQGDNKPDSQFGSAISSVGDLNQDGFNGEEKFPILLFKDFVC